MPDDLQGNSINSVRVNNPVAVSLGMAGQVPARLTLHCRQRPGCPVRWGWKDSRLWVTRRVSSAGHRLSTVWRAPSPSVLVLLG